MRRFFLALHATVPATLVVAVLLHLQAPVWLAPLAQRPAWVVWATVGAWLLMSALAALALRPPALWRVSLRGTAVLLVWAGVLGLGSGAPLAPAMLTSLAALGLACLGIAAFIDPDPTSAHRRKTPQPGPQPGAWRPRWAAALVHWPFWLTGVLAAESFRLAHAPATGPARPSGMLGLLLAFFIALPAATLRAWATRSANMLWGLAALGYGGLAFKAGLVQWSVAAVLCAIAACSGLARSGQRQQTP